MPRLEIGFAAASILKHAVTRIGDLLYDGQPNQSFRGSDS
jgi:hypothetical protein